MSSEQNIDSESKLKFAVLIDGDNAQAAVISNLLAEIAKYGVVTLKRVYGDFSTKSCWTRDILLEHAIQPKQQFAYTKGKNATDSLLIIDAMDLLYSDHFNGFCLVSSDSDFTSLAIRLRESGKLVYGFGEQKTPEAFRNACDRFIFTEILRDVINRDSDDNAESEDEKETPATPFLPKALFLQALESAGNEDGWANLGTFGQYLQKIKPDFDSRLYGYTKLSSLVRSEEARNIFIVDDKNNNIRVRACIFSDSMEENFAKALIESGGQKEWVHLNKFRDCLLKIEPNFNPKKYGYKKWSDFVKSEALNSIICVKIENSALLVKAK